MIARTLVAAIALAAAAAACSKSEPPAPKSAPAADAAAAPKAAEPARAPADRWSEAGMLAEGKLYLGDAAFRRRMVEESLVNPKNTYSRQRLESYGLVDRGWDLLPEWNPVSLPVTTATAEDLRAQKPLAIDPKTPPLWDGVRPTTMAGWVALGREVFFGYPLRVEIYMKWALEHPAEAERVGIRAGADGTFPGARAFIDVDGHAAIGITCAICHTSIDKDGRVVVGEARRAFDYGALRLAYHDATKTGVDPDLARRMKTWGPGRADVTEDDDEDPVAIPDLWGLRHQTFLTQAGTIRHIGPTALAIRQETQLLHSNHQKVRPPRELAYALAMFLYSLEPPPRATKATSPANAEKGHALFDEHCASCHSNAAYGGPNVNAERVGTDKALANGGARGTGKYRPPALIRVANAGPYFHHGAVPTLDDVLSPDRLEPTYARSPLGKGAVQGHTFGTKLPRADRDALVAFLRTL